MRTARFLLLIIVTATVLGCNSKTTRQSDKGTIINNLETDYSPPSENAAEVKIEDVAINSSQNLDEEELFNPQESTFNSSLENHSRSQYNRSKNDARIQTTRDEMSNTSESDFSDRIDPKDPHQRKSRNSIGKIDLEEQTEYQRKGSVTGEIERSYYSESVPLIDNIGPNINIGANIKGEPHRKTNKTDFSPENPETPPKKNNLRNEPSQLSNPALPESAENTTLENINSNSAGYEPPKEVSSNTTDEDIVARQIQEAASAEQDPVLREKLWKEYERYRSGL